MRLASYSPDVYAELPHEERPSGFGSSHPGLQAGLELIRKHGMEERVGLALLHRHFPLRSGEVLLELVRRHSTICQPAPRNTEGKVPYLFKLDVKDGGGPCWRPVEFVDRGVSGVADILNDLLEGTFMADLAACLLNYGLQDRLGPFIHHREHIVEAAPNLGGSTLVEFTDASRRRSVVRAADPASDGTDGVAFGQTVWSASLQASIRRRHKQICYDHRDDTS